MSNQTSESQSLVERLRNEYARTGAYAPDATCRHGIHPYDCREGCAPPGFEAADEIERMYGNYNVLNNRYCELDFQRNLLRAALLFIGKAFELEDDQTDSGITYREALAPKPMMSADGGEDIPL